MDVEELRKLLALVQAEHAATKERLAAKLAREQQLLAMTAAYDDLVRNEKPGAEREAFEWKIRKWPAASSCTRGRLRE